MVFKTCCSLFLKKWKLSWYIYFRLHYSTFWQLGFSKTFILLPFLFKVSGWAWTLHKLVGSGIPQAKAALTYYVCFPWKFKTLSRKSEIVRNSVICLLGKKILKATTHPVTGCFWKTMTLKDSVVFNQVCSQPSCIISPSLVQGFSW